MGKMRENPRLWVVSTRVDDATHYWLTALAKENNTTVSKVVEAMLHQLKKAVA
jgi:antitoxin component of RelBE/YafQ-DinJ toxin-antitoxin module